MNRKITIGHYSIADFIDGSYWLEDEDTGEGTQISNVALCAWIEKLFKETM